MTTSSLFPLVRVRRSTATSPSSATTFAASLPSWSLEIPDTVRAFLENLVDPIEVVSFVGCSQSTQDELWTAALEAAAAAVVEGLSEQSYKTSDDTGAIGGIPSLASEAYSSLYQSSGIWAWLSTHRSTGASSGTYHTPAQTLYLINRDDELLNHTQEPEIHPYTIDNILVPLLSICSTEMNIVSVTTRDVEADLSYFGGSFKALSTQHQHISQTDLANLKWHWRHSTRDIPYDPSTDCGLSTLKQLIMDSSNSAHGESMGWGKASEHLAVIQNYFKVVDCHFPTTRSDSLNAVEEHAGVSGNSSQHLYRTESQDMDDILTHDLKDLRIAEGNRPTYVEDSWFRSVLDKDKQNRDSQRKFYNSTSVNGK
ncbi:hypothetical protein BGX27_009761 [Mortierella sp. AM989]|nr:hypothetical protein BGX27_009761 [Mortierella sp. AM989]